MTIVSPEEIERLVDERVEKRLQSIKDELRPKFLTVVGASEALGVTKQSLYRWMAQGILIRHKIGGRTMLSREEIETAIVAKPRVDKAKRDEKRGK